MYVQIYKASYCEPGSHLLQSYKQALIPINPVTHKAVIVADISEIQCTADMQDGEMFEYNKCAEMIKHQY